MLRTAFFYITLIVLSSLSLPAATLVFYKGDSLYTTSPEALIPGSGELVATEILDFSQDIGGYSGAACLTVDGDNIYWIDNNYGVYTCKLDGSGLQELFDLDSNTGLAYAGLVYVGGYLYWSDVDDNQIIRAKLDGTDLEVVVDMPDRSDNEVSIGNLVVYNNQLYWAFSEFDETAGIYRSDLDGGNVTMVYDAPGSFVMSLAQADGRFYWAESFTDVYTATDDFSAPEQLFSATSAFPAGGWYSVYTMYAVGNRLYLGANDDLGYADITVETVTGDLLISTQQFAMDGNSYDLDWIAYTDSNPSAPLPVLSMDGGLMEFSGVLQFTDSLAEPFADMDPQPSSPFEITAPEEGTVFYRVRN
ncbi:MAG: hypothetical protein Q7Q73_15110 [Verrucomicrobiota bacterium JB024]|nr:hypothetical protein [Verrucomicrobiota bacterium JB024]